MIHLFTNELIQKEAASVRDYVIEMRREIHKRAEVGGKTTRTAELIRSQLESFGIPYETAPVNNMLAVIESGKPGPVIGLRADFDALPMVEDPINLSAARTCISDTPDKTCHACGHDAHTAMLLGAAKVLSANRDKLEGTIYLAFEDGEENGQGWPGISKLLEGKKIDTFWGIHVWSDLPSGKITVQAGPRMAGGIGVDITFVGKGGHGSRPDQSINPVFMAANYLNNLAVAWANQIDANETVTLGITGIHASDVGNIIGDTAKVIGSCRLFNIEEGKKAYNILKTVAEHTAAMHGGRVEFGDGFRLFGGPVVNDEYYAALAEAELPPVLGDGVVTRSNPWYASESFGRYLEQSPGILCFVGINNPAKGTGAAHHNSHFDVDEDTLEIGLKATLGYIKAVWEKGLKK